MQCGEAGHAALALGARRGTRECVPGQGELWAPVWAKARAGPLPGRQGGTGYRRAGGGTGHAAGEEAHARSGALRQALRSRAPVHRHAGKAPKNAPGITLLIQGRSYRTDRGNGCCSFASDVWPGPWLERRSARRGAFSGPAARYPGGAQRPPGAALRSTRRAAHALRCARPRRGRHPAQRLASPRTPPAAAGPPAAAARAQRGAG